MYKLTLEYETPTGADTFDGLVDHLDLSEHWILYREKGTDSYVRLPVHRLYSMKISEVE